MAKDPFKQDRHVPTERTRSEVTVMAGYGLERKDIAKAMQITFAELERSYLDELEQGDARSKVNIGRTLYELGVGRPALYDERDRLVRKELEPNPHVAQFLGRVRLKWRDRDVVYVERQLTQLHTLTRAEKVQLAKLLDKADPPNPEPNPYGAANDPSPSGAGAAVDPGRRHGR